MQSPLTPTDRWIIQPKKVVGKAGFEVIHATIREDCSIISWNPRETQLFQKEDKARNWAVMNTAQAIVAQNARANEKGYISKLAPLVGLDFKQLEKKGYSLASIAGEIIHEESFKKVADQIYTDSGKRCEVKK